MAEYRFLVVECVPCKRELVCQYEADQEWKLRVFQGKAPKTCDRCGAANTSRVLSQQEYDAEAKQRAEAGR